MGMNALAPSPPGAPPSTDGFCDSRPKKSRRTLALPSTWLWSVTRNRSQHELLLSIGWLFFVNGSYLALLRSFADGSATSRHIDSCETFSLGSFGSRFFPPASAGPTLLPDSGSGSDSYIETCSGVS